MKIFLSILVILCASSYSWECSNASKLLSEDFLTSINDIVEIQVESEQKSIDSLNAIILKVHKGPTNIGDTIVLIRSNLYGLFALSPKPLLIYTTFFNRTSDISACDRIIMVGKQSYRDDINYLNSFPDSSIIFKSYRIDETNGIIDTIHNRIKN